MKTTKILLMALLPLSAMAWPSGRVYPERHDDLAWENDLVAFRAYGPTTQRIGERAYGYDIFLKYPGKGPVLERLYAAATSPENRALVDSVRKTDPVRARELEDSFSYHIDHGYGMDCFAVGPTLGCGVAALLDGDSICYPWCYDSVEIIENGPRRFRARLTFAPAVIGGDTVTERRVITLDEGTHLNRCEVVYEGLTRPRALVAGFPVRGDGPSFAHSSRGVLAATDPTQGPGNGEIYLGLKFHSHRCDTAAIDSHRLLKTTVHPGDTVDYDWGYAWSRTDIPAFADWTAYLLAYPAAD